MMYNVNSAAKVLLSGIVLVLLLSSSGISVSASIGSSVPVNPTLQLSDQKGTDKQPEIAHAGNYVYVVWDGKAKGTNAKYDPWIAVSSDNGTTFGPALDLDNAAVSVHLVEVAAAGPNVYVVWADTTNNAIYYSYSNSNGANNTWSAPLQLSTTGIKSVSPLVKATGSNVYIVWTGSNRIMFTFSTTNGSNLSVPKNVATGIGTRPHEEDMAISGNNIYIIYDGGGVFFTASNDHGVTWTAVKNLKTVGGREREPIVATSADGKYVYATWTMDPITASDYEVYFRVNSNFGKLDSMGLDGSNSISCGSVTPCSSLSTTLTTTKTSDVIIVQMGINTARTGPSDCNTPTAAGLTFSLRYDGINSNIRSCEFYATSSSTLSSLPISVTTTADTALNLVVFGVYGANTASPFDTGSGVGTAQATTGTSHCSPTFSTINPDAFVYSADSTANTPTFSTGSGYTLIKNVQVTSWDALHTQYKVVSTPQSGVQACDSLNSGQIGYTGVDVIRGLAWGPTQQLTSSGGKAAEPQVTSAGNNVYIFFRGRVIRPSDPSTWGMYFLKSDNRGFPGSWSNSTSVDPVTGDLSQTTNNTSWGKESAGGNSVYLIWAEQCCGQTLTSSWNVHIAASHDNGATFSKQNISPDNGQDGPIPKADAPPIQSSDGGTFAYFAWQDNATQYGGNFQILFSTTQP